MDFILFIFLVSLTILFACISFYLAFQVRSLRLQLNYLLEQNAKITQEADAFAQMAKNPLGPLFNHHELPLILSFDTKGKITNVNEELLKKLGYKKQQLLQKNVIGTLLPIPKKKSDSLIERLFKNPTFFIDAETPIYTASGAELWVSWTNKLTHDAKGKIVAATAVGFDITKRKQMEAELQYLSSVDPQTGVMNRHALLEVGTTELKRAKRYRRALSVAIIKFATENPTIEFSDAHLRASVQIARQVIRSVDYIGRIGDIEFALILPETSASNIPFLIQRLQEHLDLYNQKNTKQRLFLLYGAASYTKKGDTIEGLLTQAWHTLNRSKKTQFIATNTKKHKEKK